MRIELFKGSGGWAWRIRAKNGNILATSRPYKGKRGRRNAESQPLNPNAHVAR
jgi:uncharacterized protein YegP (UPF0339 family)